MPYKVALVSLGCAKNRVDAEHLLADLQENGFLFVTNVREADVVIVNTCGFIEDSKKEGIDQILSLVSLKKAGYIRKIVVTGCLAERYQEEVGQEFPEVDAVIGLGGNRSVGKILLRVLHGERILLFPEKTKLPLDGPRVLSTPSYYAYLKIADGCDNCCSYCAIPMIRGPFRSRQIEAIIEEADALARDGVRELLVIAQDTTRYGEDLYGTLRLPELLRCLCSIDGIQWVRVLYAYPERVTDELLDVMASESKIVKYLDLPLQHCNPSILKRMNRKMAGDDLRQLIEKIRSKVPGIVLRTTFICGFPGETDAHSLELLDFVRDMKFERMGCFTYSLEENTKAASMSPQIEETVKSERMDAMMREQAKIAVQFGESMIGQILEVITEGFDPTLGRFWGRSFADAPDVDGLVYFYSENPSLKPGDFVRILIKECSGYDLLGQELSEEACNELA